MQKGQTSADIPIVGDKVTIAIVRSSYYEDLIQDMEDSTRDVLTKAGIKKIETVTVPGSFEIPLACKKVIEEKKVDGIIALGIIVQGETHHAEEVARGCTDGLMQVQVETGVPIAHGVQYVDSVEQAKERVDRGREAAITLIKMIDM